jgi:hypothetical protein
MQIHEVTHRVPTNEVLGAMASGLAKAAANKFVSSQLPGINAFDQDADQPAGTTAPAPAAPVTQKFPAFGSASTTAAPAAPTPTVKYNIPAVQRKQAAQTTAQSPAAPTWQGTNINVPAVQRKQAAQAAQAAAPAGTPAPNIPTVAQLDAAFAASQGAKTPASAAPAPSVAPRSGYRIVVQLPAGGKYYKTDKGWTNEIGQAITKPASIATLEKRADTSGREERIAQPQPPRLAGKPMRTRKKR